MPWQCREWVGKAIAAWLLLAVLKIIWARLGRAQDKCNEIVVCTGSDQKFTVDSIVAAQLGLKNVYEMMQAANIAILKIQSVMCSRARKVCASPTTISLEKAIFWQKHCLVGKKTENKRAFFYANC